MKRKSKIILTIIILSIIIILLVVFFHKVIYNFLTPLIGVGGIVGAFFIRKKKYKEEIIEIEVDENEKLKHITADNIDAVIKRRNASIKRRNKRSKKSKN